MKMLSLGINIATNNGMYDIEACDPEDYDAMTDKEKVGWMPFNTYVRIHPEILKHCADIENEQAQEIFEEHMDVNTNKKSH